MDKPAAISIKNLTKQYPVPLKREAVNAVDNLNLEVAEGEIFGFLGANGAGKTTTIKILLGLIYPTVGEAYVLGAPAGDIAVKQQIAYLPESPYFYEHMTAREVVTFYAQLFGMDRDKAKKEADYYVDLVGLGGKSDVNKRINEFSKGMRQRVGIAQSLINKPKILFYDEPTSGLDAIARRDIRDLMLNLKSEGKTMFLSSHQLEDVEAVCHRVSIIHKGKLRTIGTVDELLSGERVELTVIGATRSFLDTLRPLAIDIREAGETAIVTMSNDEAKIARAMDLIRDNPARLFSLVPKRRTLEDLFVEIVGERIDVEAGGNTLPADRANGVPQFNRSGDRDVVDTGVAANSANGSNGGSNGTRPGANRYKELSKQKQTKESEDQ